MKILITGAAGFLGSRLIQVLLAGHPDLPEVARVVAADLAECPLDDPRIESRTGTIMDRDFVRAIVVDDVDVVYHLAAVLSGQSEAEFDLGVQVNVDATRLLLEACRRLKKAPRFIFTSSLAVFGGEFPDVVPDDHVLRPQSSYGAEKAIAELFVSEYSRRGFVDGIVCRLPTISVRPGRPNAAASSFVSGIMREPLSGVESVCPVPLETRLWISSPAVAVRNLVHAAGLEASALNGERTLNLPGLTVTASEMLESLERLAGADARARVRYDEDPRVRDIVCSWPGAFDVRRALSLGFEADPDFDSVLRQYMAELAAGSPETI
jgi:nucleoside-diphosphate-sugar epimerase